MPSLFILPVASTVPARDWGVVCQCGHMTSTAGRVRARTGQRALAVQRRLVPLSKLDLKRPFGSGLFFAFEQVIKPVRVNAEQNVRSWSLQKGE